MHLDGIYFFTAKRPHDCVTFFGVFEPQFYKKFEPQFYKKDHTDVWSFGAGDEARLLFHLR